MSELLKSKDTLNIILKQINDEARENFVKTFGGINPKEEVQVTFEYPNTKIDQKANIVISMGSAKEAKSYIGNVAGTFDYVEDQFEEREEAILQVDEESNRYYLEMSKPVGELVQVQDISFSIQDNVQLEGNRIYFNRRGNEWIMDEFITETYSDTASDTENSTILVVNYVSKIEGINGDPVGRITGFTANERVNISPLSTNMDIARCLDMLMKAVLIIMRDSVEENSMYVLQKVDFGTMNLQIKQGDTNVYGRTLTIAYTVDHTLEQELYRDIKNIKLNQG